MVKIKPVKNKRSNSAGKIKKSKTKLDIFSFLKQIKANIDKIKSNNYNNKKYTLISCIFLCFYEKKKKILDKKEINDFVKKEVSENENKIISAHIKNKKNELDIITPKNYYPKLYQMLIRNRCFTKVIHMESNYEQVELNEEYINSRKNTIFKHLFGKTLNSKKINSKRRHRKFEKSVSAIKNQSKKKIKTDLKINKIKKIKKSTEPKENSQFDADSTNFSLKDNENNFKKIEDFNGFNFFVENIKLERKKLESLNRKFFLNQKRRSPSSVDSNENSLIMPLFAEDCHNENESKINNNINYIKKEELIPNSLDKFLNYMINKGKEFLSHLNNPKFIDFIKTKYIFKKNGFALLSYNDDSVVHNFLNTAYKDYMKFNRYLKFFMNNKDINVDSESEDKSNDKGTQILENIDVKKMKCSLLISRIETKLSQFLLEYDFIVEVIKEIFEYDKNCIIFRDLVGLINENKNILDQENIHHLEKLLRTELENAINYYIINYSISNEN